MKTTLYHQENLPPKQFSVLKQNPDGTVDLGSEGSDAVITKCVVSEAATPGQCTYEKLPEEKTEKTDSKHK